MITPRHRADLATRLVALTVLASSTVSAASAQTAAPRAAVLTPRGTLAVAAWPHLTPVDPLMLAVAGDAAASQPAADSLAAPRAFVRLWQSLAGSSGEAALLDLGERNHQLSIDLGMAFHAGASAAEAESRLISLVKALRPDASPRTESLDGLSVSVAPFGTTAVSLYWLRRDGDLFIATSPRAIRAFAAPGDSATRFVFPPSRGDTAPTLQITIDGEQLAPRIESAMDALGYGLTPIVARGLQLVGLHSFASLDWQCFDSREAGQRHSVNLTLSDPPALLAAFWPDAPLSNADLAIVPRDATWAQLTKLDLPAVVEALLAATDELDPDLAATIQAADAAAGLLLGFSPLRDLPAALGDSWALFDAPSHGGLLGSGTVLVASARDGAAIDGMLQRLVALGEPLARRNGISPKLLARTVEQRELRTLVLGGISSPVAPSWAVVADRLIIGLSPQAVLAAARQVDPATRGHSLLSHADLAARRTVLGDRCISLGYRDAADAVRSHESLRRLYFTALLSRFADTDAILDPATLPSLRDRLACARDYFATTRIDGDRLIYEMTGTADTWLESAAAGVWLTNAVLPMLRESASTSPAQSARDRLRALGGELAAHAARNDGRFPDEPKSIAANHAAMPPINYIRGQSWSDNTRNVLAWIILPSADAALLLLLDGDIQSLTAADCRRRVRETYKRLGRDAELPFEK